MYLRELRKEHNWDQSEVAKMLGITRQSYSHYETGRRVPDIDTLRRMAQIFGVTIDYIVTGKSRPDCLPVPSTRSVPRLGSIPCGSPSLCKQDFTGYDEVPDTVHCDFTLRCDGDSMIGARIHDGDIVYIRQQTTFEDHDIVAVLIDDSVTLKRATRHGDAIILTPENPKYSPIIIHESDNVRILGVAVGFVSKL